MSKRAPKRKRPKRVAKKIAKRFGLTHYDKKSIPARRAVSKLFGEVTDCLRKRIKRGTLPRPVFYADGLPCDAELHPGSDLVAGISSEVERGPLHTP